MYDSVKGISAYALLQMASTSDASELFLQGKGPWIAIEYACLNPDCVLTFNSREYIGCRCKETGDPEGCDSRSRYYNLPPSED